MLAAADLLVDVNEGVDRSPPDVEGTADTPQLYQGSARLLSTGDGVSPGLYLGPVEGADDAIACRQP